MNGRVRTDGKFFATDGRRFEFRGIHHRGPAERPELLASLRELGFSVLVVRSFDPTLLCVAAEYGLHVLVEIRLPPWRVMDAASRRQVRKLLRTATRQLIPAATAMRGDGHLLGAMITAHLDPGDAPPSRLVRPVMDGLACAIRELEPDILVSAHLPLTIRECPIELDFLVTAAERGKSVPATLEEAHLLVADRPLLLHAAAASPSSQFDAATYGRVADVAAKCGAAGTIVVGDTEGAQSACFATTDARSAVAGVNHRALASFDVEWPTVTVVICAYNAAATLDECLRNVALLDYPELEVIVVDDGSEDDTVAVVERHPGIRLIRLNQSGLSEARNVGFRHAKGRVIAYLDADAYPPPEWVRFLILGLSDGAVVGSGGPNIPPPDDPPGATAIAQAPGTPAPVLYRVDRAAHLPGCNMAFFRQTLVDLDGFDPDLTSGEDVDFQLRLRERSLELGYHPAAFVWHHRRAGIRTYLRQQRSYGQGQSLVAVRHPAYFHRHRLHKLLRALGRHTREDWPVALPVSYRSLNWRRRHGLDLAHQWGVPLAIPVIAATPFGMVRRVLLMPAAVAGAFVVGLFGVDTFLAFRDLRCRRGRALMAMRIATLQLLRPPAFVWGTFTQAARMRVGRARRLRTVR